MSGILSPQVLRERLVESYRRSYERAGQPVPTSALERLAVSDLEITDAHNRAVKQRAPRKEALRRERPDVLAEAQRETGTSLDPSGQTVRSKPLHGDPEAISEQWGAAVRRIAVLTASVGKLSSMNAAIDDSESPKLVRQYTEAYAYFMLRDKPAPIRGIDHNPFRGMSDCDAALKFMRIVMDICDRSTGQFGPWWVR